MANINRNVKLLSQQDSVGSGNRGLWCEVGAVKYFLQLEGQIHPSKDVRANGKCGARYRQKNLFCVRTDQKMPYTMMIAMDPEDQETRRMSLYGIEYYLARSTIFNKRFDLKTGAAKTAGESL